MGEKATSMRCENMFVHAVAWFLFFGAVGYGVCGGVPKIRGVHAA